MPKEYEVGGTVYEFPDSYDDNKVRDILSKKGILKLNPPPQKSMLQSGAEAAYEAKYGMPPPSSLGTGGVGDILRTTMAAPATIMAPVAVGTGMGVETAGRALGLPEWVNIGAGLLAGAGVGKVQDATKRLLSLTPQQREEAAKLVVSVIPKGDKLLKLRALLKGTPEPPMAPEPVRPNPNIAKKIKFGGPTEPAYGEPGTRIPRGRFKPPVETEEATAPAAKPAKAEAKPAGKKPYRRPVKDTEFNRRLTKIARERGIPETTPDMPPSKFEE